MQVYYLECGKGIRGDIEGGNLDILEKVIKVVRVEQDFREGLIANALAEHRATIESNLLLLIPLK